MKPSGSNKLETRPLSASCGIAEQWKAMGVAIGEMRREKNRLSVYLESVKAKRPWWRRWLSVG
ncbi:MAG: hypothetical protein RBS57_06415 [Desulforhabdus sp.]|jgi:hypothetical protein|nr:hypothetical protein [Desulforhabdus sp.]